METLINLLNEFDSGTVWLTEDLLRETGCTYCIICKPYWFIKWLVENNHIRWDVFCSVETPSAKYEDFDLRPETPLEDYTNILLMDLALQDQPVDFLVSILR